MLVIVGGFRGSGKRLIAREFARTTGFHGLSVDEYKLRRYTPGLVRQVSAPRMPMSTDEEYLQFFRRVTEKFPVLAKMYPDTVMAAPLHRALPREFLFEAAARSFDDVRVVILESSEQEAFERLRGKVSEDSMRRFKARWRQEADTFQPFETDVSTLRAGTDFADTTRRLCELLGVRSQC